MAGSLNFWKSLQQKKLSDNVAALANTLPYVAPSGFHHEVWEAFEKFIARQVELDPVRMLNSIHKCMNARNRRCGTVENEKRRIYLYVPQI